MFKNYLLIALRNIKKYKAYSFINIAGLALGMACCIFILLWVQDELGYDRFHKNADTIYRVEEDQHYSGQTYHVNVTPYPSAPVWKDEIPEIINECRIVRMQPLALRYGNNNFSEKLVVAADSTLFTMFTLPLEKGDPNTALNNPYSVVITQELAKKYFGNEEPIGKVLSINTQYEFTVTGVMEKIPSNSTLKFDLVVPFSFTKELKMYNESWGSNGIFTFIQTTSDVSIPVLNKKLTEVTGKHKEENTIDYMAAPLTKIHLYQYAGYGKPTGDIQYIYIFSAIALFVLLIACINFMNLTTARSSNRAKEIGIRKVVGALKSNIAKQFLSESVILAIIGLVFAVIIVLLLMNDFNDITGKEISLNTWTNSGIIIGLFLITLLTGVISGSYPALFLSSFQPVKILKGNMKAGVKNAVFRRILVTVQFSLSIFLIIGTVIIYKQLVFMKDKDLGFDQEHLLYIPMTQKVSDNYKVLRNEFLRNPDVLGVSASSSKPPFIGSNSGGVEWEGKDPNQSILVGMNSVDFDYTKTYGIKLVAGRGFSESYSSDLIIDTVGNFLVNEEMVRLMGKKPAEVIGASFDFVGVKGRIVGVMKDFNYQPVNEKIEPVAFFVYPPRFNFCIVRVAGNRIDQSISFLKDAWNNVASGYPFEFHFVDQEFDKAYQAQDRMVSLLKYFSILAILIACLGLFGLASFTAEQRKKEVGIRKVLGASELKITFILCKEFIYLVLISNLIAWPAAYYIMNRWLENYAYKINPGMSIFLLSGAAALVIALVTVSYQAIKAAVENPIKSLRYE